MKEYDLDNADTAATNDLADRYAFVLDSEAWVELQDLLDRPPVPNSGIATLLRQPSVIEEH